MPTGIEMREITGGHEMWTVPSVGPAERQGFLFWCPLRNRYTVRSLVDGFQGTYSGEQEAVDALCLHTLWAVQ